MQLSLIMLVVVASLPAVFPPGVVDPWVAQQSATAVPTPPVPPAIGIRIAPGTVSDLVRAVGLPHMVVDIARRESDSDRAVVRLNPNRSTDHGMWQMNDRWWRTVGEDPDPYDPVDNAAMAAAVYTEQGPCVWEPSRNHWEPVHRCDHSGGGIVR